MCCQKCPHKFFPISVHARIQSAIASRITSHKLELLSISHKSLRLFHHFQTEGRPRQRVWPIHDPTLGLHFERLFSLYLCSFYSVIYITYTMTNSQFLILAVTFDKNYPVCTIKNYIKLVLTWMPKLFLWSRLNCVLGNKMETTLILRLKYRD